MVRSEEFPDPADEVFFPRLSEQKLAWLAKRGRRRTFEPGEVLYEHAVRDAPFFVIERGLVDVHRSQARQGRLRRPSPRSHVHRRHRRVHR